MLRGSLRPQLELWLGLVVWRANISFVISDCPSVRMEQLCLHWTDFHEILHFCVFQKSLKRTAVSWKSNKNNDTLPIDHCTVMDISHSALPKMRII